MEIQDIIISNKLIAKFMQYDDVDCHNCKYSRDCNWIQCGLTNQEKDEQLKYHSSWDWLIPVVEKIANIPTLYEHGLFKYMVNVELNPITGIKIEDMYKRNFDFEEEGFVFEEYKFSFIENIWLACVAFIKWYSCQKEK